MKLTYVIISYNRKPTLLENLSRLLRETPLPADQYEIRVVENGSTDGTADAVRQQFPQVVLIARPTNEGMSARNHAFFSSEADYCISLDDDSYPLGDTVTRSITYLNTHLDVAALVGRVMLPDGRSEASALPGVMLGGAVCMRRVVLKTIGGYAVEFFRQAEEYELSCRIWRAGWRIERFEDLLYGHDKVGGTRSTALIHRMDLRNNLIVASRFLPAPLRKVYWQDWTQRYTALAATAGFADAAEKAMWEARAWDLRESVTGRQVMGSAAIESLFELGKQKKLVTAWAHEHRVSRVAIADLSKNIYATYRACQRADLEVTGIADNNPAFSGLDYRGLTVGPDDEMLAQPIDGIVISTVNPAQVQRRAEALAQRFSGPILTLFTPRYLDESRRPAAAAGGVQ